MPLLIVDILTVHVRSSDTAYVLSYAIIMLHTSLHNPSVKDKPTVDRFVSMNRGINNGSDLPREFLAVSMISFTHTHTHTHTHSLALTLTAKAHIITYTHGKACIGIKPVLYK